MNERIEAMKNLDWLIDLVFNIGISIVQILVAGIIIGIVVKIIKKSLKINNKISERKRETLTAVLISVVKYIVWFVVMCMILTNFGVDITSLVAVAGVGSVAIGFGAKSIVQDIITGMFILFEDQFGVGDIITIEDYMGTVENIGLRSTRIRAADGDLYIIPNGEIKIITNMSKEFNRAIVEIGVDYEEDIDNVLAVLRDEAKKIFEQKMVDGIISEPSVLGIVAFNDSAVAIRILTDTEIGGNWHVEREIRRLMKKRLDIENINIPYPKRVIEIVEKDKVKNTIKDKIKDKIRDIKN